MHRTYLESSGYFMHAAFSKIKNKKPRSAHTVCLCGYQSKQWLISYTALKLIGFCNRNGVFTARYGLNL
jgi:hypothetical protein